MQASKPHISLSFMSLIGASVSSSSLTHLALSFESRFMSPVSLEFRRHPDYGATEVWTMECKNFPPEIHVGDLSGPRPWTFWESMLLLLSDYLSVREHRSFYWQEIVKHFEGRFSTAEADSNGSFCAQLSDHTGSITILYKDNKSLSSLRIICIGAGGEVIGDHSRDSPVASNCGGPWSQSAVSYGEDLEFISECMAKLNKSDE